LFQLDGKVKQDEKKLADLYDTYEDLIEHMESVNKAASLQNEPLNPSLPPFADSQPGEPFGDASMAVSPVPGFPSVK
jgi:hypothetical protein